ncbi:MAG: hypothetical protein Q9219_005969 [cf. Caloplaca sp. 3 TL-2023]
MTGQHDNSNWFGEGFNGFPRVLPDDCVQYALYIVDAKLSDFDVRQQLRIIQSAANVLCKTLLKGFIWQHDAFALDLIEVEGHSCLQGRTNFGDSVEDEWLVVYLMRELSVKFPQSWIRVFDSDGEFLLIEACDALPKWLSPEVADNRIWINNGSLLIIPKSLKNENAILEVMHLDDALTFLQSRKSDLLHAPSIESEAFFRLQKYPTQIQESLHHAVITIPRKLAYILRENAAFISSAVEAFYLRDPISLRSLQSSQPSTLHFAPKDLVAVSVRFTKVGYAQLKGQEFAEPRAWTTHSAREPETRDKPGRETGMKVTCGFEMLLSDPANIDKKSVREIKLLLEDLETGEERLPSNDDILRWDSKQDDESWLDIDFNEFERELSGKGVGDPVGRSAGFGDKAAQDNLRRIVARFENLLNDDDGSADDTDFLNDTDDEDTSTSSDEARNHGGEGDEIEKGVDFDKDRFASMMRDIMGLGPAPVNAASLAPKKDSKIVARGRIDNTKEEEKDIRRAMDKIEDELRQAGALSLDAPPEETGTH